MKIPHTLAILSTLLWAPLLASPVPFVIESKADLETLGAEVQFTISKGKTDDDPGSVSFEVTWPSTKQDADTHKRGIELLIFDPAHPVESIPNRVESRFTIEFGEGQDPEVPVQAKFSASGKDLGSTVLVFSQGGAGEYGWQTVHYLVLRTAAAGFPSPADPFEPATHTQQGVAPKHSLQPSHDRGIHDKGTGP